MKYYFIGIKGSGMSSLALILKGLGHEVVGSDYSDYMFTEKGLKENNIEIRGFNINNLDGVDVVIVGHNFIGGDNIELHEAKRRNIKVLEYHKAIKELLVNYYSIAVSGSNGKSTTAALIANVIDLVEDTSYLIGSGEGKGRHSKYFTFEACEYKEHFLEYEPNVVLVNNIDYDHVDYFKSEESYINAFYKFINNAKNIVVVNGDDINLKKVNNVISFGVNNSCLIRVKNISYDDGISYDLYCKGEFVSHFHFNLYGKHMIYNTLACISVCMALGIDINTIKQGIKNFNGVKRRFKETIINGDVYIDDYAHHPSKIKAIIEAVKQKYKGKKLIAIYRPDRITRLDYFSSLFNKELLNADKAFILPFINENEEEKECLKRFLTNHSEVNLLTDYWLKKISKEKGVIYLMMSSKDVSEVKESILKYKVM